MPAPSVVGESCTFVPLLAIAVRCPWGSTCITHALLLQQAHPERPHVLPPPKKAPKENKPIGHNNCVNTPRSHNQEGNAESAL